MRPRIGQLLLDFDGVLARYRRERRIAHLAAHAGAGYDRVHAVLYGSGLEARYDAGVVDTGDYLRALGKGIGAPVDEAAWLAARLAATEADPQALARVLALDGRLRLAILTNNGALMARAIPRIVAPLLPRLEGRVLCSGPLGGRKPDPQVFARALDRLGWNPATTLFVDDLFVNVQGARAAGLHADSVRDARALGRVLGRYGLA
ncbi:HAD-IA family hydrolase [Pseudoxanthomonas sp.]|uniref:HAD-IA family hydrolase n=1 Tax=Pseudoxanthomonas sp. TaxID=1871049 RepID=UPI002588980A|nr:HAD-IA family hydrolase [Pseudoxanthomonas sp.]MCR6685614.1 HAD-IA family hydrolase [Pseudoxanthomonas sp.]